MPFGFAAALWSDGTASVGNGIAFKFDWVTAAISNLLSLLLLEVVVAFGAKQQIPSSVADVLHVGEPAAFTIGFGSLADVDSVFCD